MSIDSSPPFWQLSLDELTRRLEASATGLSSEEAARRLESHGPNSLKAQPRYSFLLKLLGRFRNPLVVVLLFAAVISAVVGDVASFVIIFTIVLLGVALDSLQEHRAARAAERLRISVALKERALRDGRETVVAAEELVPGDVVLLAAGDLVPADGRLLQAKDLYVNEALLTGESFPAEKHAAAQGIAAANIADASNAVFMGCSVISGSAQLLVAATGMQTELGGISGTLRHAPPPAALEQGSFHFGLLIIRLTVLLTLFVLAVNIIFQRPLLESFLFALALAVGLTPELLPMVVSVTLAQGALRMARERVIVKRLGSIHDLGSMDVLCTDKTGTLTEARIKLIRKLSLSGAECDRVLKWAWVNSHFETGLRSPLDSAVLERGSPDGEGDWSKLDEIPFDFERRRVSVLVEGSEGRLLVVKGAPEDVLRQSVAYEEPGQAEPLPLDEASRAKALALFERLGEEGFRVLGIAWRAMPAGQDHVGVEDEAKLIFTGFAGFLDPPKQDAGQALAALAQRGVAIKILTGDNERVTRHVCAELGVPVGEVLTGEEIRNLSEEALSARVEETTLFCRVTPNQKNRIIITLKRRGHAVGFLGDGINDAPSLHSADVGISVEGAVDVAKDAADIILLERDLGVLERGVREGRRTFANIMKYIMMGTSSNFGNMFSMAAATLMLPFLPMRPVQILLNNLLYDLSEVAIPLDEVDSETIARPRRWDMRFIRNFMLVLGSVSSLFDFLTFALLLLVFHAGDSLFQTGWFVESLATQALVIFVIRTRRNPLKSRPHPLLAAGSIGVVVLAVLLPYTPLGRWFAFTPLPGSFLLALGLMVAAYLLLAELVKQQFYRHVSR